ncbi:MAG TPA: hypothetical protein VHO24_03305 [Opitutaceae bacterium]|nr:hypothetical protein [Opitutaceae bacterium]
MIANSEGSTRALAWLLREMSNLPDQSDADLKLTDLTLAITAVAEAELPEVLAAKTLERFLPFPHSNVLAFRPSCQSSGWTETLCE